MKLPLGPLGRRERLDILQEDFTQVVEEAGIPYPNPRPYTECTVVSVIWNEEARIGRLLGRLQSYFLRIAVCVQASSDRSFEIARNMAREGDVVVADEHRGFAEASAHVLAPAVQTDWAFVVSADEWPSDDLLDSVRTLIGFADRHGYQAVWVPFRSTIEGVPFEEQHGHLRILRRELGWSPAMHTRPRAARSFWCPRGHIDHDRSLDELVRDYLRYLELGRGNPLWERHNTLMIRNACRTVAARHGWDCVIAHGWWPEVRGVVFG
jgi:Glycosyl transferase family 2